MTTMWSWSILSTLLLTIKLLYDIPSVSSFNTQISSLSLKIDSGGHRSTPTRPSAVVLYAAPPPPVDVSSSSSFPLNTLFEAAARAAQPTQKEDDGSSGAHDAFRFEWGRWVDDGNMEELMNQMNKIKIMQGGRVYDRLLEIEPQLGDGDEATTISTTTGSSSTDGEADIATNLPGVVPDPEQGSRIGQRRSFGVAGVVVDNGITDAVFRRENAARRFRVAGGSNWDCILHVLPAGAEWTGRWPTGSWIVLRTLIGVAEISMLRGPDRDGLISKVTSVSLRGGSDGTLGSGKATGGQDSVKYVGGAQRSYAGQAGKTLVLEVVLRPPVGTQTDGDGNSSSDIEPLPPEDVLMNGMNDPPAKTAIESLPTKTPSTAETTTYVTDGGTPPQPLKKQQARRNRKHSEKQKFYDPVEVETPTRRRRNQRSHNSDWDYNDDLIDDDILDEDNNADDNNNSMLDSNDVDFFDDSGDDFEDEDEVDGFESNDSVQRSLGDKLGLTFERVGGLDDQLDSIVRRVLASRANPEAARRLGVNHVRGILLSGPPGCGKTLLARELSQMLGAREPQIVDGPSILDKFIGEAEKNIRALFEPAEREYEQLGDDSALHVIVLDELDAIARKRGSVSGDTTGVKDSVVNQLLAKIDGVKEANNILVIGLTNRPELIDPALTRPGRLEVQLRVELPDLKGRRDILRIHTRAMKDQGGLHPEAFDLIEDIDSKRGIPARTEYFTGAELAGLVRSAASFALARTVGADMAYNGGATEEATIQAFDFEQALKEVKPALGKQDFVLEARFPYGVSASSSAMRRVMRDLRRFTSTPGLLTRQRSTGEVNGGNNSQPSSTSSTIQSLLLVGDGYKGGTGCTALSCWAGSQASKRGDANYVRLVTSLDLLTSGGGGDESARAMALVERFTEASSMSRSLLIFDDIDQICAGSGPSGYSSVMLSTLRALLRSPSAGITSVTLATDPSSELIERDLSSNNEAKSLSVIAATSRTDSVCSVLHELFDETLVVPELSEQESVLKLLADSIDIMGPIADNISDETLSTVAKDIVNRLEKVGTKVVLRLLERSIAMTYRATERNEYGDGDVNTLLQQSMAKILDDYVRDQEAAGKILCKVKDD